MTWTEMERAVGWDCAMRCGVVWCRAVWWLGWVGWVGVGKRGLVQQRVDGMIHCQGVGWAAWAGGGCGGVESSGHRMGSGVGIDGRCRGGAGMQWHSVVRGARHRRWLRCWLGGFG